MRFRCGLAQQEHDRKYRDRDDGDHQTWRAGPAGSFDDKLRDVGREPAENCGCHGGTEGEAGDSPLPRKLLGGSDSADRTDRSGEESEHQRTAIGEHVTRIGEQRQADGEKAGDDLHAQELHREHEGPAQARDGRARPMTVSFVRIRRGLRVSMSMSMCVSMPVSMSMCMTVP